MKQLFSLRFVAMVLAATSAVSSAFFLIPSSSTTANQIPVSSTTVEVEPIDPARLVADYFPPGRTERSDMPIAKFGKLDATFPSSFADPLRVTSFKAKVAAKPLNANRDSMVQLGEHGSRIYPNAFPDCDVVFQPSEKRIEEFLVVRKQGASERRWMWELDLGTDEHRLGAQIQPNGSVKLVDPKGIARMYIDPPQGRDANGFELRYGDRLSCAMSAKPQGKFEFTLVANLAGCAYPVVIDPTLRAAPRIIDGTLVDASQFPTVGEVGDTSNILCTGTLISSTCVLTAGHCYTDDNGNLTLGQTEGRFILDGVTYSTSEIIVHPTYEGFQAETEDQFDMIIMVLDTPVTGVTPSPLYRQTPELGELLTIAGYGEQGNGATGGDGTYPSSGTINYGTTPIDVVTRTFIKWDFEDGQTPAESNTAQGDSGGPAFITVNNTLYLAGTTSGGRKENAGFGDISFDVRVDAVVDWIDEICGTSGSGNYAPAFTSAASASPQDPAVNETVTFSATATDADGDTVSYSWDFQDGTSGTGSSATHAFSASGVFNVTVTASDGKGGSKTSSVEVVVADGTMLVTKARISMKFNRDDLDKAVITAVVTFGSEITLANAPFSYSFGGISGSVTLDDNENAPAGGDEKVKISIRGHKRGAVVPANTEATITFMVTNGDFDFEGLSLGGIHTLNADTDRTGEDATLDITIQIGTQSFGASNQPGLYKAREDRSGKFKL